MKLFLLACLFTLAAVAGCHNHFDADERQFVPDDVRDRALNTLGVHESRDVTCGSYCWSRPVYLTITKPARMYRAVGWQACYLVLNGDMVDGRHIGELVFLPGDRVRLYGDPDDLPVNTVSTCEMTIGEQTLRLKFRSRVWLLEQGYDELPDLGEDGPEILDSMDTRVLVPYQIDPKHKDRTGT